MNIWYINMWYTVSYAGNCLPSNLNLKRCPAKTKFVRNSASLSSFKSIKATNSWNQILKFMSSETPNCLLHRSRNNTHFRPKLVFHLLYEEWGFSIKIICMLYRWENTAFEDFLSTNLLFLIHLHLKHIMAACCFVGWRN